MQQPTTRHQEWLVMTYDLLSTLRFFARFRSSSISSCWMVDGVGGAAAVVAGALVGGAGDESGAICCSNTSRNAFEYDTISEPGGLYVSQLLNTSSTSLVNAATLS
jgi:hypothetical protein